MAVRPGTRRTEYPMRSMVRRAAMLTALALAVACAGLAPAAIANPADRSEQAVAPETVQVSGEQVPVEADTGKYIMRGDLVGKWQYIPQERPLHDVPTLYVEAGKEIFKGCIDRSPKTADATTVNPKVSCTSLSCSGPATTWMATSRNSSRASASTRSSAAAARSSVRGASWTWSTCRLATRSRRPTKGTLC